MKAPISRRGGFTLVEVMIVTGIISLLAAIAIPNFVKARTRSQKNTCISNLRQIDGAVQQWALEYKKAPDTTVDYSDISDYVRNNVICPSGGTTFDDSYTLVDVQTQSVCQKEATQHKLP